MIIGEQNLLAIAIFLAVPLSALALELIAWNVRYLRRRRAERAFKRFVARVSPEVR